MKIRHIRMTLIVAGILGLIDFFLVAAIVDQQISLSRLSGDMIQQKRSLSRIEKDTTAFKTVTSTYETLSSKLGGRYRNVSWSTQIPSVVNQVTGLMQSQGLKMQTLKPEPITSKDGVSRLPLRVSFQAGLGDLAKLVFAIERSVPYLEIERLDINAAKENGDKLQADMTISSFAIADENAPLTTKPAAGSTPKKAKTPVVRTSRKISRATGGAK